MTPPAVVTNNCTFATGQMADVAISDVFYGSCGAAAPATQPATLKDVPGPVQAMLFVVPKSNTTTQYLTAAEAQDLYGCGAGAAIAGFDQAAGIFCRDQNSGTQIIVAITSGSIASAHFAPPICVQSTTGTGGVISGVTTYATPSKAIGFIGADAYDPQRANLNSLAFAGFGQTQAYYSDSGPSTAVDRQNVRNGHYTIWGYEHMIAYGRHDRRAFTNAKAANFIGWINGTKTDPSFDAVQVEGAAGTIPTCAMSVQRTDDGGGLSCYAPTDTCNCAFEAAIGTKTTPANCGGVSDVEPTRHQHLHGRHELPPRLLRVKGILTMSNHLKKFFLVVALSGFGAVACSSGTSNGGTGGSSAGGKGGGTGGVAAGGGGGHATGGAAGGAATGGAAGGAATGGAAGGAAGAAGSGAGGAGGGTGGTTAATCPGAGVGGASAMNLAIINAAPATGVIAATSRTAPTFTSASCP